MIKLVKITKENYQACINLKLKKEQALFMPTNLATISEAKENQQLKILLVELDKQIIGMLAYALDDDNDLNILRVMIDENFQGQNYGAQSLRLLLEKLKTEYQHDKVWISLHFKNIVAIKLYEKMGFKRKHLDFDTIDELFYCLTFNR